MAAYRLLENLAGRLLLRWANKPPKCGHCKAVMQRDEAPPLFLLPVFFDHDYTPSAAYYRQNCRPIRNRAEIPTGQRACRIWTLACAECGQRKLLVEDFLQVRDTEAIEKRSLYDADELDLVALSRI